LIENQVKKKMVRITEGYSTNDASTSAKKTSCICYTNYNESVIRNNVCTICNRHVDVTNNYENTIKRKYQQQEINLRPR
jgi:hypothetical protein